MGNKVRVLVVGVGNMGLSHAKAYKSIEGFELVGLIRLHWRGLSGGDKVWQELETFFARLKALSTEVITGPSHA